MGRGLALVLFKRDTDSSMVQKLKNGDGTVSVVLSEVWPGSHQVGQLPKIRALNRGGLQHHKYGIQYQIHIELYDLKYRRRLDLTFYN